MKKSRKNKVSILNSIKTKILVLIVLAVLATVTLCMWTVIPLVEKSQEDLVKNYMMDMVLVTGAGLDKEIELMGAQSALTAKELEDAVGDVSVEGMDSSYAYVVDINGTMLYHPTADKIGQPVENAVVKQILKEIGNGNKPEPEAITYEFKGAMKYASFYIGENTDYILVLSTDEDEALSGINVILKNSIYASTVILVLCSLVGLFVAIRITKPIGMVTTMVSQISELDFRENKLQASVSKRKDETGVMGRALDTLQKELTSVIRTLVENSKKLYEASSTMSASAGETSNAVEQVERAISEISQGATSQAQETQTAAENVLLMGNMIEETNQEVEALRTNAREMRSAGDEANDILSNLDEINQRTKEAVQIIYDQTNTTNESVMKIKKATEIISEIATETNLLSLNASIEAARAGEQGRGFAVVAGQIRKLAEQSNASAREIDEIISLLIADSEKSVATMEDVKSVIEKQNENVENTEEAFLKVKDGISKSIDSIRVIASKTQQLDEARIRVVDVVQNLNAIAEENAASTQETSASAAEVGSIVVDIAENAKQLNGIASQLDENTRKFIVE